MIIEQLPLSIDANKSNHLSLTDLQKQYLQILAQNHSISSLVEFYLKQGWLVHFVQLWELINKLIEAGAIGNSEVTKYFEQLKPQTEKSFLSSLNPFSEKSVELKINIKELPFFRSLPPDWTSSLLKQARTVSVPSNVLITKENATDRDLYVLLHGHASIIKSINGMKQVVAQMQSPSIFGEGAFFLGQPRTADILTRSECVILKIQYTPDLENFIKKDKAEAAQIRIWTQHALGNSQLFKNIPADAMDALTFAGRPVRLAAKQCLFAEGQPGSVAYIVIQGELVVSQKGKIINQLKQGSFLGEISLLASGGFRTATIHAQTESLLIEIDQQHFYSLLGKNLFIAKEIETLAAQRLAADKQRAR